jgi:hypothetical protein
MAARTHPEEVDVQLTLLLPGDLKQLLNEASKLQALAA